MKKTIAVILIAMIVLSLSACNQASDQPIVPNASNTLEKTAPSTITDVTTAPSTTTNVPVTPSIEKIPTADLEEFYKSSEYREYRAKVANSWEFRSVDEFETFMATGNYPNQEELLPEDIPPHELFLKVGYIPSLIDALGLNEDDFDKIQILIVPGSDYLHYSYSLCYHGVDYISINVTPTPFCDVVQARDFTGRGDLSNNPFPEQFGDVKVEYTLINSEPRLGYFTIDNYLISISSTAGDNSQQAFYRFMNSEETASVVPLFTRDAATVEAFVKKVRAAVANQTTAS